MKDQHFVVTGGAKGIGAEICSQLRALGARLTVLDLLDPGTAQDKYVALDLSQVASVDRAVSAVSGPIHGLLNIAGLPPRPGTRSDVLRVNFFGLRRLTLALLPKMAKGGSIVNLSSRAGSAWRQNIEQVKALMSLADDADIDAFCNTHEVDDTRSYLLSKEAVTVWTMAQTEGLIPRGLRMNAVSPSAVDTGILDDFKIALGERATKGIARMGRPANVAEVAAAAVFLASPASAWLKGVDLPVDGGLGAMDVSDALSLKGF